VPTVAVVVLYQSQAVLLVWLKVVVFVPFASVRLPVALPMLFQTTVPLGMSAATTALKVGAAAAPVVGPAKNVFAVWFCGVGRVRVPAADAVFRAVANTVPSPAS